ncbi:MAG: hypothetical protein V4724_14180 [Pseudomonadota bacterium]
MDYRNNMEITSTSSMVKTIHQIALMLSAILCSMCSASTLAESTWPQVPVPKDLNTFAIGEQLTAQGLPMRMHGFLSPVPPARLIELFRQSMGQPLVENTVLNKHILGRAQGEHYMTVQLEPAGMGSRGVIAVTQLRVAYNHRNESREQTQRLLSQLPGGSRILSQMTSGDGGKLASYAAFSNTGSTQLNAQRIKDMMHSEGLAFERETAAKDAPSSQASRNIRDGTILSFKGNGKEAIASIFRNHAGQTIVVLNTVASLGNTK